ncbi:MAG: glycosyltransferase family 4 protein [Dorea sp.]|nr:glycosyltransferase family 4 protein [Dorea sp.]
MKEFVFFGTGDRGKKLYKLFRHYGIDIKYWVDSDKRKWNKKIEGKTVYPPYQIQSRKDIKVCVSAMDISGEMYQAILSYGIPPCNIYTFYEAVTECVSCNINKEEWDNDTEHQCIILDCSNGLVLGGVESWSISMLQGLTQRKYEAYLISPYGEYQVEKAVKERTIWLNSEQRESFGWESLEHISEVLRHKMPCVFVSSVVNDSLLAACSLKKKYPEKICVISVVHQEGFLIYKEYSELNHYIDKYIAVSRDIQNEMIRRGIKEEKVLHMTCPVKYIEPYKRGYSLNDVKPLKIGYAGRIECFQKRLDCLEHILKELERRHTNYQVEIAGDGNYLQQLKEEVKNLGLMGKVKFVGKIKRTEIPEFWTRQDICINLSDFEGRSISVMEAMANGAVPIVTETSGVREDIEDGVNGYIVSIGDYVTMAGRIDHLSEHRELLKQFGDRAHDVMAQKGNMDKHMDFWNTILQRLWNK